MKSMTTAWNALVRRKGRHQAVLTQFHSSQPQGETVSPHPSQFIALLPVPAFVVNTTGIICEMNKAMTNLLGYAPGQLVGGSLLELVVPSHHTVCTELLHTTELLTKQTRGVELAFLSATDTVLLMLVNMQFLDTTPPLILGIGNSLQDTLPLLREALDLSVALEARNAELQRLNQELDQAQHQRERVTNMLIHDIRGPLVATSASFDIIQRGMADVAIPPMVVEAIAAGRRGLRTVLDLTNDLLDMKKLAAGHHSPTNESFSLLDVCVDLQSGLHGLLAQHRVAITLPGIDQSFLVRGDSRLIGRAIFNILTNAIRFSPAGGVITLAAQKQQDGSTLVTVSDQGPGVASHQREQIFQPFVQGAGESRRGTGLGLAFCREVFDAHRGRIWVEEAPGGGSRFCMMLPA